MGERESVYANISALNWKELKRKYPAVNIDNIVEKK